MTKIIFNENKRVRVLCIRVCICVRAFCVFLCACVRACCVFVCANLCTCVCVLRVCASVLVCVCIDTVVILVVETFKTTNIHKHVRINIHYKSIVWTCRSYNDLCSNAFDCLHFSWYNLKANYSYLLYCCIVVFHIISIFPYHSFCFYD